jgi:hypothetical protein
LNQFLKREFWLSLAFAGVAAVVAAAPIMMSAVMQRGFEIGKLALAQPLAILAAGAVLASAGPNMVLRRQPAARLAFYSVIALVALAAISTALADHPEAAFFGSYDRHEGLLAWFAYGAFFIAVAGATDCEDGAGRFVDIMLMASVVPAAYALQQRLDFDFYPLGIRDATRSDGTLGSPVFMAAYMAQLIPLTVARCCEIRRSRRELIFWSTILLIQVGGILVTQTRGPLISLLIGLILFALCIAGRRRIKRMFGAAAGAAAYVWRGCRGGRTPCDARRHDQPVAAGSTMGATNARLEPARIQSRPGRRRADSACISQRALAGAHLARRGRNLSRRATRAPVARLRPG